MNGALLAAVSAALLVSLTGACAPAGSVAGREEPGDARDPGLEDPAPGTGYPGDFTVRAYQGAEAIGGETVSFSRLVGGGRPVVLNFWGGLCPPCRDEMPAFQRAHERFGDRVLFLGVDVGPFVGLGGRQDARDLIAALEITYPNGWTFNVEALKDYRVRGLPKTWFFKGDGTVYRVWNGLVPEAELNTLVEALASD